MLLLLLVILEQCLNVLAWDSIVLLVQSYCIYYFYPNVSCITFKEICETLSSAVPQPHYSARDSEKSSNVEFLILGIISQSSPAISQLGTLFCLRGSLSSSVSGDNVPNHVRWILKRSYVDYLRCYCGPVKDLVHSRQSINHSCNDNTTISLYTKEQSQRKRDILVCHCCSVTKSCPTLQDPMDCSMPCVPVPHHLLEWIFSLSLTTALSQ